MTVLQDRLELHARLHDEHVPQYAEHAQWAGAALSALAGIAQEAT